MPIHGRSHDSSGLYGGGAQGAPAGIALQDILSALTFALDLTEGAVPGHALRCVLLGMRIAEAIRLPEDMLGSLYYALQLKDVGCSSNSARVAQLFGGDERRAKALSKITDWTGLMRPAPGSTLSEKLADWRVALHAAPRNACMLWELVLPTAGFRAKMKRLAHLGKHAETNLAEMVNLRCDRGAYILHKLQMSELACEAVRRLDERWDGSGFPGRLRGENIPILARICAVAQHLDVFATSYGQVAAIQTLLRRQGTWFDPELVRVAKRLHRSGKLWTGCEPGREVDTTREMAVALSPDAAVALPADRIDAISEAFADVVDAKSPFTFRHSIGVTATAVALAEELNLPRERVQTIRRAALLHDLGKLGVPNSILDKPGKLTEEERQVVSHHPLLSGQILSRISGFDNVARIAAQHHERLDGSGYPWKLCAEELSLDSRLLAVADIFAALAEDRPYRGPIPVEKVLAILREDAPEKLDVDIVEAMESVVAQWNGSLPSAFTEPSQTGVLPTPRGRDRIRPLGRSDGVPLNAQLLLGGSFRKALSGQSFAR